MHAPHSYAFARVGVQYTMSSSWICAHMLTSFTTLVTNYNSINFIIHINHTSYMTLPCTYTWQCTCICTSRCTSIIAATSTIQPYFIWNHNTYATVYIWHQPLSLIHHNYEPLHTKRMRRRNLVAPMQHGDSLLFALTSAQVAACACVRCLGLDVW
jgi:hypothetical protein